MLDDKLLDAACLLSVDRDKRVVTEPFENQDFNSFVGAILRYVDDVTSRRGHGATGAASLGRALAHSEDIEAVVSGLTSTREGLSAVEAAVIRERRRLVLDLRHLALDPSANETKMQAAIEGQYWLFGGQYIGIAERRTFVPLDQYDVPLICADGSIEIVELKGPESSTRPPAPEALDCVQSSA